MFDIRVQKIGPHYRAYTRTSSNWKTNVGMMPLLTRVSVCSFVHAGSSILKEVPVEKHWQRWADLASTIFDGLDILTVDGMRNSSGDEVIIEINDTASGFAAENKALDMKHVVDLCTTRLNAKYCAKLGSRTKLSLMGKGKGDLSSVN